MKFNLSEICFYNKEKIAVNTLTKKNYISTENMQPNKGGIVETASLPTTTFTQSYEANDILISNIRPYFKKIWFATSKGGCSNDILVIRAKNGINPKFLYYILSDDAFFNYSSATSKGTKMPRGDKTAIMQYQIPIFDLNTQNKIAYILGILDEKIQLNTMINDNLFEQLHLLFVQMFSDTDMDVSLGDVVETTSGGTPSRKHDEYYENGLICWVKSKELIGRYIHDTEEHINDLALSKSSAKLLPAHSVLIAMYGATVGAYGIISKPMTCNQAVCALLSNENYPYTYLFQIAKELQQKLINLAAGSAQQNISQVLIKQLHLHNNVDTIRGFHILAQPLHQKIELLQAENNSLSAIRDNLLPKLMSGELDVLEVDL